MTISAVVPDIAFAGSSGSGTMGPFSLVKNGTPLVFFANSEVVVLRYDSVTDTTPTLLVEGTDYTLTGGPTAGSITLTSPQTGLLTAERLYVTTLSALAQSLDLVNGGNFSSSNLERRLDVIFQILQQHAREIKSTIRFAMFDTDEIPKTTPLEAVIGHVAYPGGTASAPTVELLNVAALADLTELSDEDKANVAIVAADLSGPDTIGIVAADLAGDNDIGAVADNMADVTAVAAAGPAITTVAEALDDGLVYTKAETDTLLDGKQDAVEGIRLIEEWAVADGVADDTAAVNTAVAFCRDNNCLLDWGGNRGKRVKITSALVYTTAGHYNWANVDIDGEDVPIGAGLSPKVSIRGPALGSAVLLSTNASAKATQITVASALTVGALYLLQSNNTANGDGVTKRAELIKIRSLASGTTYNLEEPLQSAYTTAAGAQVQLFSTTVKFTCTGGFRLLGDPASTSANDYGLALIRLYQAEIERFHGSDIAATHLLADMCVNSSFCSDYGWFQRAKNTGAGYGLEIAGGFNLTHGDLWGEDMRHVRTVTHTTTSFGHGALGNLLGRGLIGGNIMGDDMLSSADDSHAGFIDTITGDCITNIAAGVTVPEAFVIENAKVKYGRIIFNGAETSGFVIQSFGHPDSDQNYIEIESISGSMTGTVADWGGFVANRAAENGHAGNLMFLKIGLCTLETARQGIKIVSQSGPIFFEIGMGAITHNTFQALYMETSASHGINGIINFLDARDSTATTSLIYGNASAGSTGLLTINAGRLVKSGATGAIFETSGDFKIVVAEGVSTSPGSGGLVSVGSGSSVLIRGQTKEASLASGSAVSLTTGNAANVTSLSLEPGVWSVSFQGAFTPAGSTSITRLISAINATSATIPAPGTANTARNQQVGAAYVPTATPQVLNSGETLITLTATTTIYAIALGDFTVSTLAAYGRLIAKRVA